MMERRLEDLVKKHLGFTGIELYVDSVGFCSAYREELEDLPEAEADPQRRLKVLVKKHFEFIYGIELYADGFGFCSAYHDEEEELADLPEADKEADPMRKAMICRVIDGKECAGQVEDIQVGKISQERLYLIKYSDGDIEHFTADQVWEHLFTGGMPKIEEDDEEGTEGCGFGRSPL